MIKVKFNLKDKVTDTILSYRGVITAIKVTTYCEPVYLVEGMDSTGRPIEWWLEESRLVLIGE